MLNFYKFVLFITAYLLLFNEVKSVHMSGLEYLAHILNGDFLEAFGNKKIAHHNTQPSFGETNYIFLDYITYKDKTICYPYDEQASLVEDKKAVETKKPQIVKCVPAKGNGTLYMVNSLKEAIQLLSPHGNSTKRSKEGSCVFMLFYTTSCIHSAMVAPHYNALARHFPDIKVAAVDAFKFHALNTEFGIVGLPSILFFHQGRPVAKFNDTQLSINTFIKFIQLHSDVSPTFASVHITSEDFNGPLPSKVEQQTDYCLYLAWIFIIVCGCYYFSKSKLYTQIVEMVKNNWRESIAHHHRSLT